MPIYKVQAPDGSIIKIEGPEGATDAQISQAAAAGYQPKAKPETSLIDDVKQGAGNLAAGLVRGAGSIGATIMAPKDIISDALDGKGLTLESNRQRRKDMDSALGNMGAETDSWMYKGGKLAGEIAGTAGAGGVLANGVRAVAPGATGIANALATGGFRAGSTPGAVNMLTRAAGGAATGAVSAGMVNPEDAGLGAVVGGALPVAAKLVGAGASGAGKFLRGGELAPEVKALASRAKELGINIPADRLVDSKPLNALAASLNYTPFSGRAATEEAMNSQLNKALSKTFGQDSSNVTQALRKADTALGGEFERVLKNNTVKFDKQLLDDATAIFNQAEKELGSDALKPIASQIDELFNKGASGVIDGQAAYNIKKTLDRIGRGSGNEAYHAVELKKVLMEALDRSLGSEAAAAFATTRQQYGNMLNLEKLAKNGAEGEISVARLANMKNINNPQMQELADIAAQFVKPREGAHGSMQRAVVGGVAGVTAGPLALAGGAAAGRSANMLLNSNFGRNMAMGETNPAVANALARALPLSYRAAPVMSAQ